tara:strand:- start:854 stop:1162 length:309 start_codon:yes stop_codon:yes gene_type:complete
MSLLIRKIWDQFVIANDLEPQGDFERSCVVYIFENGDIKTEKEIRDTQAFRGFSDGITGNQRIKNQGRMGQRETSAEAYFDTMADLIDGFLDEPGYELWCSV